MTNKQETNILTAATLVAIAAVASLNIQSCTPSTAAPAPSGHGTSPALAADAGDKCAMTCSAARVTPCISHEMKTLDHCIGLCVAALSTITGANAMRDAREATCNEELP